MDGFGMEGLSYPTETSSAQWELELTARDIYANAVRAGAEALAETGRDPGDPAAWETSVAVLQRDAHVAYLRKSLHHLSAGHVVLDASRCWLCYWIVHALALLGESLPPDLADDVVEFLALCQHPDGGFGGGPGQMPHLAPTYAATACLAEIATPRAFAAVDRVAMLRFLHACHDDATGGYRMHEGGETDTRGCYTALAVAHLTGLTDPALAAGLPGFVTRCQTHEGGVAGEPGAEAHGGYAFCGLAAAVLCGRADALDLPELVHWLAHRQGAVEGGFMGRTNKLVDGCYSFWQGGAFPLAAISTDALLRAMPPSPGTDGDGNGDEDGNGDGGRDGNGNGTAGTDGHRFPRLSGVPACSLFPSASAARSASAWDPTTPPFSSRALQGWLLLCCQLPNGGLQDKPGKGRDHYHTCYCLSGLSVAQHWGRDGLVGPSENLLQPTDPIVNVVERNLARWMAMVAAAPNPSPR